MCNLFNQQPQQTAARHQQAQLEDVGLSVLLRGDLAVFVEWGEENYSFPLCGLFPTSKILHLLCENYYMHTAYHAVQ